VAAFLTTKLELSAFAAELMAMLVAKLFPSITELTDKDTPPKKKPRSKKRKTSSSAKTETSSKKKATARPKTSSSKPAAKKEAGSKN
jgi:hypothetical protein